MNPYGNALDFAGKTVLVVGGSSGIGNGIAQGFRACGASVHVTGTRPTAQDYAGIAGSDLEGLSYHALDVTDTDRIAAFAPGIDRLDALVLSQGQVVYKRGEFEKPGWDRVMSVNLDSLLHCATHFRERLAESAGALIIVSSISGYSSNIGNPAYAASKAGAISLTKTLGEAWARDGIRVNGIAPGLVETKLTEVTWSHPQRREAVLQKIAAGRIGTPDDMARVALFLASPLASYVIGQTLIVDGGLTLS